MILKYLNAGDTLRLECRDNTLINIQEDGHRDSEALQIMLITGGVWQLEQYVPPPKLSPLQEWIKRKFKV